MEPRRLLSTAVEHGVLSIEGTRRSDTIVLTMDSPRTMRVRVNNVESTFLKKSFSQIRISCGMGDDLVTIGSDATPILLPASVSGDDGADTIVCGAGNDSVSGGAGADQITGAGGDDSVNGDNGNDDLHGGDGRDSLCGGKGDDELHDDAGRDSVVGNAGTDLIYFHDDVKQFRDQGTAEKSYAEPIFQMAKPGDAKLVINKCPLYAPDGTQFSGGLVKAGGSTLVMSGNVLRQWAGEGLGSSNVTVPHFELPGGSYSGAGGTLSLSSGSSGSYGSINYTSGSLVLNTGTGTLNKTGSGTLNLVPIQLADGQSLSIPSGSIITKSGSSTQTIASGQTLTVAGAATITTPDGTKYSVADSITVMVTGMTSTSQDTFNLPWKTNPDGTVLIPTGSIVASADGSTQILSTNVTAVITGPSTITLPGGSKTVVNQGVTATVTTTPADGPTLVDLEGRRFALPTTIGSSKTLHLSDPAEHAVFQVIGDQVATMTVPLGTLVFLNNDSSYYSVDANSWDEYVIGGKIGFPSNEWLEIPSSWTIFTNPTLN